MAMITDRIIIDNWRVCGLSVFGNGKQPHPIPICNSWQLANVVFLRMLAVYSSAR